MQSTNDIDRYLTLLKERFPEIAARFHVRSLGVFGSYVRHEERPESDLDILVSFEDTPGLITFLALENHLADVLGVKVDLVMEDALKPHIGERILSEVVPV